MEKSRPKYATFEPAEHLKPENREALLRRLMLAIALDEPRAKTRPGHTGLPAAARILERPKGRRG